MKMGMSRLLIALAAVAAGGAIFAAARRYTPVQDNAGRETVELNLLMSLGGDGMREEYMRRRLDAYGELNPDVNGKGYHYAYMKNPEACIGCASCGLVCPDSVITVYKKNVE